MFNEIFNGIIFNDIIFNDITFNDVQNIKVTRNIILNIVIQGPCTKYFFEAISFEIGS